MSISQQSFTTSLECVKRYHQQTKHDFNRYARSLGYLDWANQPDPFRRFDGAPLIRLPLLSQKDAPLSPLYEDLYHDVSLPSQPVTMPSLSRFFEYALSITAWKQYGENRWALRANPSSGNLHPTEGYLFVEAVPGLSDDAGLYHYAAKEHALEWRMSSPSDLASEILKDFPVGSFLVGFSSIYWREAWKYGERAFRYCQHDIGHAIGTARIAARTLGWNLIVLSETTDDTISALLGLNRETDFSHAEKESPELVAVVWPSAVPCRMPLPLYLDPDRVRHVAQQKWYGQANRLSHAPPVPWEIIDDVSEATRKTSFEALTLPVGESRVRAKKATMAAGGSTTAGQIIHQRRSAVAFDGCTSLSRERFFLMLKRVFPQSHRAVPDRPVPWDAIPWEPTIHLAMFVHRVDGLEPGLYLFLRSAAPEVKAGFQQSMQEQFVWSVPEDCPRDLPLFLLEEGNAQKLAMQLSCWQDIAGDSAFSLGMIAEFDKALETYGSWFYRRLFWEAGLIGQVLYVEAEAAGVRATGIGCFFDDPVHQVLGFFPRTVYQSLYHFTVGWPVEDERLTTLPPYGNSRGE